MCARKSSQGKDCSTFCNLVVALCVFLVSTLALGANQLTGPILDSISKMTTLS